MLQFLADRNVFHILYNSSEGQSNKNKRITTFVLPSENYLVKQFLSHMCVCVRVCVCVCLKATI